MIARPADSVYSSPRFPPDKLSIAARGRHDSFDSSFAGRTRGTVFNSRRERPAAGDQRHGSAGDAHDRGEVGGDDLGAYTKAFDAKYGVVRGTARFHRTVLRGACLAAIGSVEDVVRS